MLLISLGIVLGYVSLPPARAGQATQPIAATPAATPASSPSPPAQSAILPHPQPYDVSLDVRHLPASGGAPGWSYFVPLISALVAGAVAVLGVLIGQRFAAETTAKTLAAGDQANQRSMWQKANETELAAIQGKLDGFYGPFMQLSASNQLIANDLRSRQEAGCRLLLKVFDQAWKDGLSPGDSGLLHEVCENAAKLEKLILEQAGVVHPLLLQYLSRGAAHFRALYLAHEGKLGNDHTHFVRYVFPRALDPVIRLEVDRLKARAQVLRDSPGTAPPPVEDLIIPAEFVLEPWPAQSATA